MTSEILVDRREGVAVVTLNRPARRNAMSVGLVAALIQTTETLARDEAVGAIVLLGSGNGFCAGSDLGGLATMSDRERCSFEEQSGRAAGTLVDCAKPVVAAVHGFAIGGGLTLAAACDVVVAAPTSRWSLPEVPIGLFPAWGLAAVEARIGTPVTRRLCWGVETWDGAEAARHGLVDMIAEDPIAEALSFGAKLAALPRAQVAATKAYFARGDAWSVADVRANGAFMAATASPEAIATLTRFGKS